MDKFYVFFWSSKGIAHICVILWLDQRIHHMSETIRDGLHGQAVQGRKPDERKRRSKNTALSPRSGVPSRAKRTGDKHKALSAPHRFSGDKQTCHPGICASKYPGPRTLKTGRANWVPGLRFATPGMTIRRRKTNKTIPPLHKPDASITISP